MIIHEPEVKLENGEVILSARVEVDNRTVTFPETLWYAFYQRTSLIESCS